MSNLFIFTLNFTFTLPLIAWAEKSDTTPDSPQNVADWHIEYSPVNTGQTGNEASVTNNNSRHTYAHTHITNIMKTSYQLIIS